MTPVRFTDCLAAIGWTEHGPSRMLECDPMLVEAWATGSSEIPSRLGAWLETLAKCHEAIPPAHDVSGTIAVTTLPARPRAGIRVRPPAFD